MEYLLLKQRSSNKRNGVKGINKKVFVRFEAVRVCLYWKIKSFQEIFQILNVEIQSNSKYLLNIEHIFEKWLAEAEVAILSCL